MIFTVICGKNKAKVNGDTASEAAMGAIALWKGSKKPILKEITTVIDAQKKELCFLTNSLFTI